MWYVDLGDTEGPEPGRRIGEGGAPPSCSRDALLPGEVMAVQPFKRITVDPNQMGGMPCIRGLRIPVATIVGMVAEGMAEREILEAFPDLEREDIREALEFAAEAVRERELPLAPGR